MPLRQPVIVGPNTPLLEMLSIFQSGHCHMAFISNNPSLSLRYLQSGERPGRNVSLLGIVCLEDVLEKIIQEDITDESDYLRNTRQSGSRDTGGDSAGGGGAGGEGGGGDGQTSSIPRNSSKHALPTKLLSISRRSSIDSSSGMGQRITPSRAAAAAAMASAFTNSSSSGPTRAATISNLLSLVSSSGKSSGGGGLVPGSFPSFDEDLSSETEYNTYQNGSNHQRSSGGVESLSLLSTARNNSYNFLEMEHSPTAKAAVRRGSM